jgi:hypothetical protein
MGASVCSEAAAAGGGGGDVSLFSSKTNDSPDFIPRADSVDPSDDAEMSRGGNPAIIFCL